MAGKRRKPPGDALEAYRRVRKPVAPPERILADRRRRELDRIRKKEASEAEFEAKRPEAD